MLRSFLYMRGKGTFNLSLHFHSISLTCPIYSQITYVFWNFSLKGKKEYNFNDIYENVLNELEKAITIRKISRKSDLIIRWILEQSRRIYLSRAGNLFQLISSLAASSWFKTRRIFWHTVPRIIQQESKRRSRPFGDSEEVPTKSKSFILSLSLSFFLSSFRQAKKKGGVWNERRIYTEGEERIEEGIRGGTV